MNRRSFFSKLAGVAGALAVAPLLPPAINRLHVAGDPSKSAMFPWSVWSEEAQVLRTIRMTELGDAIKDREAFEVVRDAVKKRTATWADLP